MSALKAIGGVSSMGTRGPWLLPLKFTSWACGKHVPFHALAVMYSLIKGLRAAVPTGDGAQSLKLPARHTVFSGILLQRQKAD